MAKASLVKRMSTVNATPARGEHGGGRRGAGAGGESPGPKSATSGPIPPRKGEGAFRLRPREHMPPRPLDKYQLRETKRRMLQGLGGSRQTLLGPWACAHPSSLRRDLFCGEHKSRTPSCLHPDCFSVLLSWGVAPAEAIPLSRGPAHSFSLHGLHSCLPAPAPPGLWQPSQHLATLAPVAAAAPAPSTRPEAPSTPAPAGSHAPCSPYCPRLPAQVGRLWPTLPPAGRGPGGPGPSPSCLLGPPAGLALGPALWAALRGTCGPEPCGPNPTCHCHCHPSPHRDPRPHPHPQAGPRLCTLLPTQAPAAGGQSWLHRPGCQQ